MAGPKQAKAKARKPIGPTEALQILMGKMAAPAAAKRLNDGLYNHDCGLWRNGKLIRPAEIAHFDVLAMFDEANSDRWYATVADDRWDAVPAEYEFDYDEVRALLPKAPEPQPAEPTAPEPTPSRRKPGKPPKHDWPQYVAFEVGRIFAQEKRVPTAPEMLQWCEDTWGWQPDLRQMQRLLKSLLDG